MAEIFATPKRLPLTPDTGLQPVLCYRPGKGSLAQRLEERWIARLDPGGRRFLIRPPGAEART